MRGPRRGLTLVGLVGLTLLLTAAPALAAPTPSPSPAPGTGLQNATAGLQSATSGLNQPISLVLLLGASAACPGLLIMVTAFTRIVIVLGFTRTALGTQPIPPNQVLIGLSLFLTLFVMAPGLQPGQPRRRAAAAQGARSRQQQAFDRGVEPFRGFMLKQVREKDLAAVRRAVGQAGAAEPRRRPDRDAHAGLRASPSCGRPSSSAS